MCGPKSAAGPGVRYPRTARRDEVPAPGRGAGPCQYVRKTVSATFVQCPYQGKFRAAGKLFARCKKKTCRASFSYIGLKSFPLMSAGRNGHFRKYLDKLPEPASSTNRRGPCRRPVATPAASSPVAASKAGKERNRAGALRAHQSRCSAIQNPAKGEVRRIPATSPRYGRPLASQDARGRRLGTLKRGVRPPRGQPGRLASMTARTSGSSGTVRGRNRATTDPSGPRTNFSKFHMMSPASPEASGDAVSSS